MKLSHIIALVLIAAATAVMFSTLSDAGTYDVFNTAFKNQDNEYHIIGQYNREAGVVYDPAKDPNLTVFYLVDTAGVEKKVVLHEEKPTDFEKSERVVVIGKAKGDEFHAHKILMKCPSKYNNASAGKEQGAM